MRPLILFRFDQAGQLPCTPRLLPPVASRSQKILYFHIRESGLALNRCRHSTYSASIKAQKGTSGQERNA